jgi:hypothetical protein
VSDTIGLHEIPEDVDPAEYDEDELESDDRDRDEDFCPLACGACGLCWRG